MPADPAASPPDPADLARDVLEAGRGLLAVHPPWVRSLAAEVLRLREQNTVQAARIDNQRQRLDKLERKQATVKGDLVRLRAENADLAEQNRMCHEEYNAARDRLAAVEALTADMACDKGRINAPLFAARIRAALGDQPPPAAEISCPSCGATIRARMADQEQQP